jgi:hypothetical protein
MFTNEKNNFDVEIANDLESGKKVFMCSMSADMANKYYELYNKDYKVLVHSSMTDDELKQKLQIVNEFWTQYDLVICSPSVESGVDFNVEYFEKMYVILSDGSTHQRGLNQMTNRVRKLKNLHVNCYLNGLPYAEKANLYTLDEAEVMFKKYITLDKFTVTEDGNLENNTKNFNCINKYNYLETLNKNKSYFVPYLLKLLKQKHQTWTFDKTEHKKTKDVNLTKEMICSAPNIDKEEYLKLLELQKKNQATTENKLCIERYMYKFNWELKELDDETMSKIYRKTHIMFNNKAINNVQSKPFITNRILKKKSADESLESTNEEFLSVDETYQDVSLKVKLQKLKVVNETLQSLNFKNSKNEFTKNVIEGEQFNELVQKTMLKSALFKDVSTLALFEMNKNATKKITSNKAFLGFINKILANYAVKIQSVQESEKDENGNKINKYSIKQIKLLE